MLSERSRGLDSAPSKISGRFCPQADLTVPLSRTETVFEGEAQDPLLWRPAQYNRG